MRLDANQGDTNWTVIHVPRAERLRAVIWVDDETHQWEEYVLVNGRVVPIAPGWPLLFDTRLCRAKRIKIVPSRRLVLIDPIEDPDAEKDEQEVERLKLGQVRIELTGIK